MYNLVNILLHYAYEGHFAYMHVNNVNNENKHP